MGWFDSLFPEMAAKRSEARVRKLRADAIADSVSRRFEGAATGRRSEGWRAHGSDANAENGPALSRLRNRARDLRRNNPYAERAISGIADNVVGYGIVPRPAAKTKRANAKLAGSWAAWGETTSCDADGLENFYGLEHKVVEAVVEAGEIFIRRRWRKASDKLPVPMQLQLLEADFLDEGKNGQIGAHVVIQGIEFDAIGRRVAYWMFEEHPGSSVGLTASSSKRIPAEDIIHVFLPRRPGQARGYTWLAPVMQRLRNFDEMEDTIIEQAKIACCFAVFLSEGDSQAGKPAPLLDRVEPGIIQQTGMGQEASFATPPTFNGYSTYAWQALHAIAVGLGVPHELLSGDLKGVNFSSGRMGWLHFARRVDVWQWRMLIPQLCERTWQWFMEAQALTPGGVLEDAAAEWVPPRREMVDPKSEIDTLKDRLRIGVVTWQNALRELGITDPDAHAEELAAANALFDKLGLVLDSDPRKVSNAGLTQARPAGTEIPSTDINPTQESQNNDGDNQDP